MDETLKTLRFLHHLLVTLSAVLIGVVLATSNSSWYKKALREILVLKTVDWSRYPGFAEKAAIAAMRRDFDEDTHTALREQFANNYNVEIPASDIKRLLADIDYVSLVPRIPARDATVSEIKEFLGSFQSVRIWYPDLRAGQPTQSTSGIELLGKAPMQLSFRLAKSEQAPSAQKPESDKVAEEVSTGEVSVDVKLLEPSGSGRRSTTYTNAVTFRAVPYSQKIQTVASGFDWLESKEAGVDSHVAAQLGTHTPLDTHSEDTIMTSMFPVVLPQLSRAMVWEQVKDRNLADAEGYLNAKIQESPDVVTILDLEFDRQQLAWVAPLITLSLFAYAMLLIRNARREDSWSSDAEVRSGLIWIGRASGSLNQLFTGFSLFVLPWIANVMLLFTVSRQYDHWSMGASLIASMTLMQGFAALGLFSRTKLSGRAANPLPERTSGGNCDQQEPSSINSSTDTEAVTRIGFRRVAVKVLLPIAVLFALGIIRSRSRDVVL